MYNFYASSTHIVKVFLLSSNELISSRYQLLCSTCFTFYLHHTLPFKSVTDLDEPLNAKSKLSQTKILSVINGSYSPRQIASFMRIRQLGKTHFERVNLRLRSV